MGQNISTINSLNTSINDIITYVIKKYSVLINPDIINIILKIYEEKIKSISEDLYQKFYYKLFGNKKYDMNEFKNYIKNKILLIYKVNRYLEICDQKLTIFYGSNWNKHVSTAYKVNLGTLYLILDKIQNSTNILTSKELKSLDENYNSICSTIDKLHKNFFINKLKIPKKEKSNLISTT